jgi:hypothetical protein
MLESYSILVETSMRLHYNQLRECDKRRYAGIEALKLGFGGQKYISILFSMSPHTLRKGIRELSSGTNVLDNNRQRKPGGGRKSFFCPSTD